ncbi:MAG: PIN domain-containing protein [Thaumarchaeota archaeon]|nr:type II toxin-antitoxin system VapC family toxin [Nitrososphaerota archaeon]MBI3116486.1 type II toxin-antitoxin system VapC family toxin [Nitrososphaerota archaeon]MCS4540289.1 PIN domain-containing protein [Nitrososphaerota archaeon]
MIFVDTTFWVGDADANDDFHASAHLGIDAIRKGEAAMALTTDFVLDETVTILGKRKGFGAANAAKVGQNLLSSPRVFAVYVDEALMNEALKRFPEFNGKLSFTDVISLVVMSRYGVREIFSHDKDFDGIEGLKRIESPTHH